jgi:hypothetical protein
MHGARLGTPPNAPFSWLVLESYALTFLCLMIYEKYAHELLLYFIKNVPDSPEKSAVVQEPFNSCIIYLK